VVRNNKTSASSVKEMTKILGRLEAKHVQLTVTEAETRFDPGYYYRKPRPDEGRMREPERTKA
jgi:hypothetical protein